MRSPGEHMQGAFWRRIGWGLGSVVVGTIAFHIGVLLS